jgi:calpain-7
MQTPKKSKQYSDHEANPDRFGSNSRIMSAAVEAKARDAEQSTWDGLSGKTAFDAAVEAAELYLQALKLADNRPDRARLSAKCKELLSRSEQLGRHRAQPLDPEQPVSTRTLTTREKIILVEGSKLNGFKFPIWERAPGPGEFELKDGQEQFVDSPRLQLSPLQLESFAGWKRPGEALGGIEILRDGEKLPNTPTMARLEKIDLVQDMTSDCSVVASLCAGTARAERGHPRVSVCTYRE